MLPTRVIPCLDVRDGRVVKGVRFRNLQDQGDPAELAGLYEEQGADEIVVLDVDATTQERNTRFDTVAAVRARISIPLTVGGGIARLDDAAALLEVGADKVAVNTAALLDPDLLNALAARFGSQCVVIAIDAQAGGPQTPRLSGYRIAVRSGATPLKRDAVAWAREAVERGAGEILLTSIDRDGTRSGYEISLLRAVREAVPVPIVASGGADTAGHMAAAIGNGADAVLAASIFHQLDCTVGQVKSELASLGVSVRPAHRSPAESP